MNEATLELVRQWVKKAQSDWDTALILSGHEDYPRDSVCFHSQQHVEKLLKAILTLHGIEAPRTHNLRRLIQLAEPVLTVPPISRMPRILSRLTALQGVTLTTGAKSTQTRSAK